MNWRKERNELILETGKRISFDFPIKSVNESSTCNLEVELDIPVEKSATENNYCISKEGEIIRSENIISCSKPSNYPEDKNRKVAEKCSMDWAKEDKILIIDNKKRICFDYPIRAIFETCGILIVDYKAWCTYIKQWSRNHMHAQPELRRIAEEIYRSSFFDEGATLYDLKKQEERQRKQREAIKEIEPQDSLSFSSDRLQLCLDFSRSFILS